MTRYADAAGTTVVGTTTHDYDPAGRHTHLASTNGSGAVLANDTYTFDAADRMETKVEGGVTTSYGYDTADQLTADGAATFGYDATGNRTNAGYATGTGNRLTTDGTWTYTYDPVGNVTKRSKGATSDTWVYGYDHRNQMTTAALSATNGGTVTQRVTYVYDAFGNRIGRDAWDGVAATVERFGMDGWDPAKPTAIGTENFDTWVDLDGSNALTTRRAFGTGFDELVARQDAGGTALWYLTDYQQSVRQLVDNSGAIVGTLAYSAYGQVMASSGTTDRYRSTGREEDALTGLRYNRGRVYNTTTGTWLSADSMGFAAGDSNLYRYVVNQVTTKSDPSGLADPTALSYLPTPVGPAFGSLLTGPYIGVQLAAARARGVVVPRQKGHPEIVASPNDPAVSTTISYTRGSKVTIRQAEISLPLGLGTGDSCIRIKAETNSQSNASTAIGGGALGATLGYGPGLKFGGENGMARAQFTTKVDRDGSMSIFIKDLVSDNPLPDQIDVYDMRIQWQISLDGRNWMPIQNATAKPFTLYSTYKLPAMKSGQVLFQTSLHAATLAARGAKPRSDEEAVEILFAAFRTKQFSSWDGKPIQYYGKGGSTDNSPNFSKLLTRCDGQCDDWANLLIRVLRAQGLAPSGENGIWRYSTKATNQREWFLVKGQWNLDANRPMVAPFKDKITGNVYNFANERDPKRTTWQVITNQVATVPLTFGKEFFAPMVTAKTFGKNDNFFGQNTRNPYPSFNNHVVVFWGGNGGKDNGIVYDPSYGTVSKSKNAFVDTSIMAFVIPGTVKLSDIRTINAKDKDVPISVWLFRTPTASDKLEERWTMQKEQ